MAGSAESVQRTVYALESGHLAVWIRRTLAVLVVLGICLLYYTHEFRGLATSQAMDQAQMGREMARGHLWHTKFLRPRALGELQSHGKNVAQKIWVDTYNAPLPPLVNAFTLFPIKSQLSVVTRDANYIGDKAIVLVAMAFFLASVVLLFFIARRLFDRRLALLACALVLICDTIWQYSLSGLPQMLLLFLFNGTTYFLVRAVQAEYRGGSRVGVWLALSGVGFGLLALTHALTIWIFVAAFIYCVFFFRPRGWTAMIVLVAFVIVYTPWLLRNYIVCGQPGGVAIYSVLDSLRHSEAGWMRRIGLDVAGITPSFVRNKITANLILQFGRIFQYLGWSVVASMFFVSLLHRFRRTETAAIRWLILSMWAGAVLGMATFGISEEQDLAANQLHLLFIPLMTCYGLAFLLVLWKRLEINARIARIGFLVVLFVLCGWPMITTMLLTPQKGSIRWPPYMPPYISVLNIWMKPNEITASDMPWAVAWYADRPAVWLPENVHVFTDLSDYEVLGAPVNGLYLTSVSGGQNTLDDILKGEYKDWADVILKSINLQQFPLKWATVLGPDCIFLSDHDRQKETSGSAPR